ESELSTTLLQQEKWAIENLDYYEPLPLDLIFKEGDSENIRKRFIQAIRINPDSKLIPYLQLLPGEDPMDYQILSPGDITPLKQNSGLNNVLFVGLNTGKLIDPLHVLVTANDEPDMGMDVGLYENNGTTAGKIYGFGIQPFGNPNLEYGSQAPIHMGLYHETKLVKKLAPFLGHCLPEYRIHLYKTLAELAFREGQDYWGWRFMGWGLHYIADLAQPYHTRALPGVSTGKMIRMNLLNIMGFPKMQNHAIQLVSNRHTAIESFERQLLEKAYLENNSNYLQFQSLGKAVSVPVYQNDFPRKIIAKQSNAEATLLDQTIADHFPATLVSDPEFELGTSPEQKKILEIVQEAGGDAAVSTLEKQINDLLQLFSIYGRSYVVSILAAD
ncbi:MAG: hypothetical protein KAI81_06105, partial [Candidatus Marinimicrobia bacterium]|nr:hypothetical protein [Candidatus Neomarinimicrobiota bacterium]